MKIFNSRAHIHVRVAREHEKLNLDILHLQALALISFSMSISFIHLRLQEMVSYADAFKEGNLEKEKQWISTIIQSIPAHKGEYRVVGDFVV